MKLLASVGLTAQPGQRSAWAQSSLAGPSSGDAWGPCYTTVVSDSHYQSTLDAVYVYVVSWSEFPIVPSHPHYPHLPQLGATRCVGFMGELTLEKPRLCLKRDPITTLDIYIRVQTFLQSRVELRSDGAPRPKANRANCTARATDCPASEIVQLGPKQLGMGPTT